MRPNRLGRCEGWCRLWTLYTSFKSQVFGKVSSSRKSSFPQGGKRLMFAAQDSNAVRIMISQNQPATLTHLTCPASASPSSSFSERSLRGVTTLSASSQGETALLTGGARL